MLSDFLDMEWTVEAVERGDKCKVDSGDKVTFVQHALDIGIVSTSSKMSNQLCWRATSLQYDALQDQLRGAMKDGDAIRYVSISLDRSQPGQTPARIHCYVSIRYAFSPPQPDDGSWTAGGQHP